MLAKQERLAVELQGLAATELQGQHCSGLVDWWRERECGVVAERDSGGDPSVNPFC